MTVFPPGKEPGVLEPNLGIIEIHGAEAARVWPKGPPGAFPAPPPPPDKPPDPPVYPPPVAAFTYTPPSPGPAATVTFDGSGSRPGDPAAPITGYAWSFNSGAATGTGVTATWKMPAGHGSYPVKLTVTASDGKTNASSQTVTN